MIDKLHAWQSHMRLRYLARRGGRLASGRLQLEDFMRFDIVLYYFWDWESQTRKSCISNTTSSTPTPELSGDDG